MTPMPRIEAKIIAVTKSSALLMTKMVISPVRPSWIEPTIAIAPTQKINVAEMNPLASGGRLYFFSTPNAQLFNL